MAKNVQLTVDIKGGDSVGKAAEKTKSLKQELRELKNELSSGSLVGKAFDDAAKKAGQLQERLDDVNQQVKSLANNNAEIALNGFMSLAEGITGGFSAAQGAMALFGSENEDLQKQLVKIQGAMALLNGIQAINNSLKKEEGLLTAANTIKTKVLTAVQARYTAVVGTSTGALKLMRIAGAALGIGLIVTAIGLLIANFDKIKKAVLNFIPALANIGELFTKVKNAVMDFVGISSEAERAIDAQAKANEKSSKQIDRQIALLEAQGGKEREIFDLRYKQLRQDADLLEMKKKKKLASQEEIDQLDDLRNAILVLNQEETNRQNEVVKNEQKKNEEAAKKRKEAHDKKVEQQKKDAEDLKKLIADETQKLREQQFSDQAKEISALQLAAEEKIKIAKGNAEAEKLISENLSKDIATLNEKYRLEAEEKQKDIDEKKKEKEKELREKRLEDEKDYAEQTIAVTQAIEDSKVSIAQQGAQLLNQVAGQSKGLALAALAIEKGAAIASVIINTQRAIAGYTAAAAQRSALSGGTTTAFDTALAAKQIAAAKISAGLNIASIAAAGISGAKNINAGGSGSGGSGGSVQPPNIRGSQTTNEPTSQPATKVFVTETDIRSSLRKVDGIYSQSTII
jgi:hypothetical protein